MRRKCLEFSALVSETRSLFDPALIKYCVVF